MRQRSLWTSLMSFCLSSSLPFISLGSNKEVASVHHAYADRTRLRDAYLFMMKCPCRFALISSTRCMAFTAMAHTDIRESLLYLTGTLRRFSNSKAGSTVNSLPAALRNALVQRVLRGFLFFLNSLWHLDRQNLKICVQAT
ncbi:unnamed protein product [Ixodes hexagonus]